MNSRNYGFKFLVSTHKTEIKIPVTWYSTIATFFFIGRLTNMPGTIGSFLCYPLYYLITHCSQTTTAVHVLLLIIIISGLMAIKKFQEVTDTYDHSYIVIDEVIGQMLTLIISINWLEYIIYNVPFLLRHNNSLIIFLIAFALFRYFDIKKPWIIGYVNDNIKTPIGVILDDILAALAASVVILIFYKCFFYYNHLFSS